MVDIKPDSIVELTNGHFLDASCVKYYNPHTSVFLRNEIIYEIGNKERLQIKPDITIDVKNSYVIPGLFNTHCHIQMNFPAVVTGYNDLLKMKLYRKKQIDHSLKKCIEKGITTIRDAHTDLWPHNKDLLDAVNDGTKIGPRIYQCIAVKFENVPKETLVQQFVHGIMGLPGRNFEGPTAGTIYLPKPNKKALKNALKIIKDEKHGHFIKLYEPQLRSKEATNDYFRNIRELVTLGKENNLLSTMHHTTGDTFRMAPELGIQSLAHLPINQMLKEQDIENLIHKGIFIEPTLSLMFAYGHEISKINKNANLEIQKNLSTFQKSILRTLIHENWIYPLQKNVSQGIRKLYANSLKTIGKFDMSGVFKYYSRYLNQGHKNFQLMHKMGVKFATGNDAGTPPITISMINLELTLYNFMLHHNTGLQINPTDILKIATIQSAAALGLEKNLGSIEKNKIADFVFYTSNPLEKYNVVGSNASAVIKDGAFVSKPPFEIKIN